VRHCLGISDVVYGGEINFRVSFNGCSEEKTSDSAKSVYTYFDWHNFHHHLIVVQLPNERVLLINFPIEIRKKYDGVFSEAS
jgi:hypothetical protein